MKTQDKHIGAPMNRVDGHQKVTGAATYSAEYDLPGMSYGVLVGSTSTPRPPSGRRVCWP
jgi:xanthine dehydrogenase YagR molybdenum-binding subunit